MATVDAPRTSTHPQQDADSAGLIHRLQRTIVMQNNRLSQQQKIIVALTEKLREVGQGEWCAGFLRGNKHGVEPEDSLQSSDESSGDSNDDWGEKRSQHGFQTIPTTTTTTMTTIPTQPFTISMTLDSPPLYWTGTEYDLIPVRLRGTRNRGQEFYAMIINSEFLDRINDALNSQLKYKRYMKEKISEYKTLNLLQNRMEQYDELRDAGKFFYLEDAKKTIKDYNASVKTYDLVDELVGEAEVEMKSCQRKVMRRIKDVISHPNNTSQRIFGDSQWFTELAELFENKYEGPDTRYFDQNMPEDGPSDDTDEEDVLGAKKRGTAQLKQQKGEGSRMIEPAPSGNTSPEKLEKSPTGRRKATKTGSKLGTTTSEAPSTSETPKPSNRPATPRDTTRGPQSKRQKTSGLSKGKSREQKTPPSPITDADGNPISSP